MVSSIGRFALKAVGERIVAENLFGFGEIFAAEKQSRRQAFAEAVLVDLLRADKRLVQIERQPGIFPVDIAADGVSMPKRNSI
jgi:hypothetical protein